MSMRPCLVLAVQRRMILILVFVVLVLVFACLIPKAQRETNCKSIIWHSLDNEEFFYLVLEKEVIKIEEF